MSKNNFLDGQTIDLNKVPRVAYTHQEFPKMVYHADGRVLTVADEKAERAATRKGFGSKPVADRDYHLLRNGRAPEATELAEVAEFDLAGDGLDDQDQLDEPTE